MKHCYTQHYSGFQFYLEQKSVVFQLKYELYIFKGLYITWTSVHMCTVFPWIQIIGFYVLIDLIIYSYYQSMGIDDKYIIAADLVQVIICRSWYWFMAVHNNLTSWTSWTSLWNQILYSLYFVTHFQSAVLLMLCLRV